jgi:glycosyltransferase involved in cell wall biosynthesis
MRRVAVFKSSLLPYSETFIKAQVGSLRAWTATLVGIWNANQLSLTGLDVLTFSERYANAVSTFTWKARGLLGIWPQESIRRLERLECQLVHAHFGTEGVLVWPLARALRLPLLVTLHGVDITTSKEWWRSGRGGILYRRYPSRLLKLGQAGVQFIAVSEAVRRSAVQFGLPESSIHLAYIGIDTRKFSPGAVPVNERPKRVLFIGRLVEKKGCHLLIRAFAQVSRVVPEASLVIVGDGPLRDSLYREALSLGANIRFVGRRTPKEVKEELDCARVLCLPSVVAKSGDSEGFPIVSMEAQAAGVPIVTSAVGARDEGMIPGVTGYAVAEGDVMGIAHHLQSLLVDERLLVRMSSAAARMVRDRFDIVQCTRKLEAIYDRVSGV